VRAFLCSSVPYVSAVSFTLLRQQQKCFRIADVPTAHELLMHVLDASSNLLAIPRRWYAADVQHPAPSLPLNITNPTLIPFLPAACTFILRRTSGILHL